MAKKWLKNEKNTLKMAQKCGKKWLKMAKKWLKNG